MRLGILIAIAACGRAPATHGPRLAPSGPQLPPPPPIAANARGAAYLTALAARIQPAWGQFLEDCRLRLPSTHALNQPGLAATAELAIARDGRVDVRIATGSGNGDYDTAVFDVLGDTAPLPGPPPELASDDDLVHVRWLFARDGRQAGSATAQVIDVELPLLAAVDRLVERKALDRAAARVAAAPSSQPDRMVAAERVMIASLREGLDSSDSAVRRAAVEAIGRARVQSLAGGVHRLILGTADTDLRFAAISASATLGDPAAVSALVAELQSDFAGRPRTALAKLEALVALGHGGDATPMIRAELAAGPSTTGLAALGLVPDPQLAPKLETWFLSKDRRIRAAVCTALPAATPELALKLLGKGLRDADATVRATCTDASVRGAEWLRRRAKGDPSPPGPRLPTGVDVPAWNLGIHKRLGELARDRDSVVRAHAIAALGVVDPAHQLRAISDPTAAVRAASVIGAGETDLGTLATDPDPDVRAAAITALADLTPKQLVLRAADDLAAPVRKAVITMLVADEILDKLANDQSPDVATAALVRIASRRGLAAITSAFSSRLAAAPAGGPERVRIALAWLLAR